MEQPKKTMSEAEISGLKARILQKMEQSSTFRQHVFNKIKEKKERDNE